MKIERMTPSEYKNSGAYLTLNYHLTERPFGEIIIASSVKGIVYLAFVIDQNKTVHRP